jgi:hypothetical protein
MKKLLLTLFLLSSYSNQAQVVFCPPGAEWNYLFELRPLFTQYTFSRHEKVKYVRDSVINNQTTKVLKHTLGAHNDCFDEVYTTLIKQSGDTVFFRNAFTKNNWQVLYNFAATTGQSWVINLYNSNSNNPFSTYTMTVESVSNSIINSLNHRVLIVKDNGSRTYTVTERFGATQFLFNFSLPNCDSYQFKQRLCYYDNTIGEVKYSALPCNYENPLGLTSLSKSMVKLSPNPTGGLVSIEIEKQGWKSIRIMDVTGKEVLKTDKSTDTKLQINMEALNKGIYFIQLLADGKLMSTEKIIKE